MIFKRRMLLNVMRYFRKYGTKPKLVVELEKSVCEAIEINKLKPRHHPGVIKNRAVDIPQKIVQAINTVIQDQPVKALYGEGEDLARYLNARHLPIEEEELQSKQADAQLYVERQAGIDSSTQTNEERESFRLRYQGKIQKVVRQRVYSWQPIQYDDYNSKLYLVGRAAAEHAVVQRIFTEMKLRIPNFKPLTLLDFGSGVGTVTWVANTLWGDSLREYFNVDSSVSMNNLASLILRDGQEKNEMPLKGVFYRQFLPVSQTLKYDIVVSAYSLSELPNLRSRLETVLTLWNKTRDYLVIIEQGTNTGFQAVNEAREFILDVSNNSEVNSTMPAAHIFAPCPHDQLCPRMMLDNTPCNFQVSFNNTLNTARAQDVKKERFSYVVIKKGLRSADDPQWPRIVRDTVVRSKHTVCRLCTASGKLQEIVFTASKQGKIAYTCARASNWGDLLPISIQDKTVDSKSPGDPSLTEPMDKGD